MKETINLLAAAANSNVQAKKMLRLKKMLHLFRSCISKIKRTLVEKAEVFDIDIQVYNLLETILWHQRVNKVIIKIKLMMLVIIFQMVNNLSITLK